MRKKKSTIRTKLTWAVCLIISAAFFMCAAISCVYFYENKRSDAQNYLDTVVSSIQEGLDSFENDINRIMTIPYYFGTVDIANKYADSENLFIRHADLSEMSRHLNFITELKSDVSIAYIPLKNGRLISLNHQNSAVRWESADIPWLNQCDTTGKLTMIPYHDASFMMGKGHYAVSFARALIDIGTMQNIGYLVIDLDAQDFQMCIPQETTYGEKFYILNDGNDIVYPYCDVGKNVADVFSELINTGHDKMLISRKSIDALGLTVIGVLEHRYYISNAFNLLKTLLLAYMVIMICSIILILIITKALVRPIQKLHSAMLRLVDSNFSTHIDIQTNDELQDLAQGFNLMVSEIQRLLEKIQKSNLQERKILLSLFQRQMSPHFIYNSLETLSSMALVDGNYQLADGIVSLSRLMRHLTNTTEDQVYLTDELQFVENYIHIQSLTSGTRVTLRSEIDLSHEYLITPKFILQPLVENIYRHAGRERDIVITIASEICDDCLLLSISDDGKGIDENRLKQIRRRIYSEDEYPDTDAQRHHGFALQNIHRRIRLLHGEKYGLSIESCDSGFTVRLRLPIVYEKEGEYESDNR